MICDVYYVRILAEWNFFYQDKLWMDGRAKAGSSSATASALVNGDNNHYLSDSPGDGNEEKVETSTFSESTEVMDETGQSTVHEITVVKTTVSSAGPVSAADAADTTDDDPKLDEDEETQGDVLNNIKVMRDKARHDRCHTRSMGRPRGGPADSQQPPPSPPMNEKLQKPKNAKNTLIEVFFAWKSFFLVVKKCEKSTINTAFFLTYCVNRASIVIKYFYNVLYLGIGEEERIFFFGRRHSSQNKKFFFSNFKLEIPSQFTFYSNPSPFGRLLVVNQEKRSSTIVTDSIANNCSSKVEIKNEKKRFFGCFFHFRE